MSYGLDHCSIALKPGSKLEHVATDIGEQLTGALGRTAGVIT